ncbi:MAG TPA: N-terminal phage integrase SAM-like domain-containing protein [Acidimicrobiales bacterium]|nr:N-terminal phage integrase SAM-like domain-containing protein [Acidimicrobiales bacterium]
MAEFLVELDKGLAVDPSRQTLGAYLDDWLATVGPSLRPTTADLYRRAVDNWIIPRIGAVPLQALTPKHLQDLYAELLVSGRANGTGGLSARSVRLAHQVLHLALDRAADWRLITRKPASCPTRSSPHALPANADLDGEGGTRLPGGDDHGPPGSAVVAHGVDRPSTR